MNMTTPQDRATDGAYARMMQAWQWLCEQRTESPDHADIWDIRWQQADNDAWLRELTDGVLRGDYHLSPMPLVGQGDNRKAVWGAQDALVLKWAALSIQHLLPLHKSCEHVQGHGGGKPSVHKLHHLLTQPESGSHTANNHGDVEKKTAGSAVKPDDAGYRTDNSADNGSTDTRRYKWVCRTDICGYYRNINKATLINQVRQHVQSPVLRDLVDQYIHYTVEDGGTFHTPEKGISRGCPLSPLMGALHLYDMDEHFVKQKAIHYARYMDDIIILAKSRWSLRRHTKRLMQGFSEYGFEAHPDKTYIGRTEKGFDWMGAWLTHEGVTDIAPRAKANHREKVRRLYERLARVPLWHRKRARQQVNARVSTYRKRWNIWAGGLVALASSGAATADMTVVLPDVPPDLPVGGVLRTIDVAVEGTVAVSVWEGGYNMRAGLADPRAPLLVPALQAGYPVFSGGAEWAACGLGVVLPLDSLRISEPPSLKSNNPHENISAWPAGSGTYPIGTKLSGRIQVVRYAAGVSGAVCDLDSSPLRLTFGYSSGGGGSCSPTQSGSASGDLCGFVPGYVATTPGTITIRGIVHNNDKQVCSIALDRNTVNFPSVVAGSGTRGRVIAAADPLRVSATCTPAQTGPLAIAVHWSNPGGVDSRQGVDTNLSVLGSLTTTAVGVGDDPSSANLVGGDYYADIPLSSSLSLYPSIATVNPTPGVGSGTMSAIVSAVGY